MNSLCPYCKEAIDVAAELVGLEVQCPHCGEAFAISKKEAERKQSPAAVPPPRFRYSTIVLRFDEKGFAFRKDDLLQGLAEESVAQITRLGNEGWELVSVLPLVAGKGGFLAGKGAGKDSAIAFFKLRAGAGGI